ncbi:hypothetical protein GCM10017778_37070 [Streptomyces vinaceus]|nr:hypothetical protein GCM10017778_37070 [Streptomyces vinaceus]
MVRRLPPITSRSAPASSSKRARQSEQAALKETGGPAAACTFRDPDVGDIARRSPQTVPAGRRGSRTTGPVPHDPAASPCPALLVPLLQPCSP